MVRKNKNSYVEINKPGSIIGANWYIKNADELKKTINSTIYNLEQFSKTGVSGNIKYNNDKKEVITKKREDGTATDENVQTMNRYVQELKDYRSFLKLDMFKPGNQDEIKSYADNRWVGGFDMKTIRMNYLVEWKDPGVSEKTSLDYVNIIASSKYEAVISFINKLIDAREKERTSAVDKTNEFIKIKSSDYQEKINNQNQSSIDNNSGGSSGSTETGTTGDGSGYDGFSYRTYWYVRLGSLVEFANTLMDQFDEKYETRYTFRKFKIVASNNEAEYLPNVKSAYPIDVYFPDSEMGSYNNFAPFYDDNTRDITAKQGECEALREELRARDSELKNIQEANKGLANQLRNGEDAQKRIPELEERLRQLQGELNEARTATNNQGSQIQNQNRKIN